MRFEVIEAPPRQEGDVLVPRLMSRVNACIDCVAEGVKDQGAQRARRATVPALHHPLPCVAKTPARQGSCPPRREGLRHLANGTPPSTPARAASATSASAPPARQKALAVDHDHNREAACAPDVGWMCVRALLCSPCNQVIGRLGVRSSVVRSGADSSSRTTGSGKARMIIGIINSIAPRLRRESDPTCSGTRRRGRLGDRRTASAPRTPTGGSAEARYWR